MATPSSSATSPSPPMAYLPHTPLPPQVASSASVDPLEREQRKKAVQKFLARAEISMVTRALRARLSYASYKATHNIPHIQLRDLEAQTQTQSQTASFSRTIAAKRKAAGANNYYNNPATQGHNSTGAGVGPVRRGGSGTMAPPTTVSSPRTHYPASNGSAHATSSNNDSGPSSRSGNSGQSLYTSILAPPPAKQARTIHNAGDPPVPAPSRPTASPRARAAKTSVRSIAEGTRAQAKGRQTGAAGSPDKRKAKRGSPDKGKQKQKNADMDMDINPDVDGDVDMKAAATLTSLLLHHRPSIAGSASSPRSSIDGSDTGSTYSYSHFAQSSARTAGAGSAPVSAAPSTSTITDSSFRNQTPSPTSTSAQVLNTSTPRPAPTDNEAANLMLYLATSPSPARPPNKDERDAAAYRALGGGPSALRTKGRVLFPTSGEPPAPDEPGGLVRQALARGGGDSFTSSISSIGTEMGIRSGADIPLARTSSLTSSPAQLLPPPPLTTPASCPSPRKDHAQSPKPGYHSQMSVDFNINDFIHASPSPARGTVGPGIQKTNLGLRADVGRKLFEEEQMRHAMGAALPQSPMKKQEERGLSAGIDLVQQS